MYTSRCEVVYIIIYIIISAFGVFVNTFRLPDHIPWVRQLSAPIEATSVAGAPVHVT